MSDLFLVEKDESRRASTAGLPPDWKERESALDIRQSWIVEAPAGSGKTGLLIQRYLKLLADESVEEPEQVLAITFTVKATTEMRERVMAQLEAAAYGEGVEANSAYARTTRDLARAVLNRSEQLGWKLLDHPQRLKIRTIDSVCGEIARLLPVLAGAGARMAAVEDPTTLYREAARRTLMQLGGPDRELDGALKAVLLRRDGSFAECEKLLMEMLALRYQWGEFVPLTGSEEVSEAFLNSRMLPQLQQSLDEVICAGLTEFARTVPAHFLHAAASLAAELGHMQPYGRGESPIAICASKVGLPTTDAADLAHWRALLHLFVTPSGGRWRKSFAKNTMGFEMTSEQKQALKSLLDEIAHREDLLPAIEKVNRLPSANYPEEQWIVAKALFRVLSRALAELKVVFAHRRECDFAEWGLLAEAALRENGAAEDFNAALGMRLQHLLVDEMQDTSTGQYELIRLLTEGWDGRSQTVFLVGDPKQSIYLFRHARVERFVRTMRRQVLGDLPLGLLQLTANFRSQGDLVNEFNEHFSLLFPQAASAALEDKATHVQAHPVRQPSESGAKSLVWHAQSIAPYQAAEDRSLARREREKAEALEVREIIERWRDRPLPAGREEPWKIAVLVRSRNVLPAIVAELKDERCGRISFRAVQIEPLRERQEVLDLVALTRALLHPADRVAWFAVLHAPWCGLGLADLHMLAGADDAAWKETCVEELIEQRGNLLSEEGCVRLARVWPILGPTVEDRDAMTMMQRVERTWKSLGGDTYLTASELANATRYLQLLDELEEQEEPMDLAMIERKLGTLFAEPASGAGLVDLMTIHGAKGLEWDVVIVPGLEKRSQPERPKLLTWSEIELKEDGAARVILAPIDGRGEASTKLHDWLRCIAKEREEAERRRLFYVACTRAREELHLFASPQRTSKGEISVAPGSLLEAAWPAARQHFAMASSLPLQVAEPAGGATMFLASLRKAGEAHHEEFTGEMAAGAAEPQEEVRPSMLKRLAITYDPKTRFAAERLFAYDEDKSSGVSWRGERPEGSFAARAIGNAVHTFLDTMTQHLQQGKAADNLEHEISSWRPRIAAVLRRNGLRPAAIAGASNKVNAALTNTLADREGRWLLRGRDQGFSELALTSSGELSRSWRMDRVFFAGERPLSSGEDCLWIVDYKTTTHGRGGIEEFLTQERAKYASQIEGYAQLMQGRVASGRLRLGLYYPMLPKLIWWER